MSLPIGKLSHKDRLCSQQQMRYPICPQYESIVSMNAPRTDNGNCDRWRAPHSGRGRSVGRLLLPSGGAAIGTSAEHPYMVFLSNPASSQKDIQLASIRHPATLTRLFKMHRVLRIGVDVGGYVKQQDTPDFG